MDFRHMQDGYIIIIKKKKLKANGRQTRPGVIS